MISEKNVFFEKDVIHKIITDHIILNTNEIDYKKFVSEIINATTIISDKFEDSDINDYLEESKFFENHK